MNYTQLKFEIIEGVGLLTLNRPYIQNKLSICLMNEIRDAMDVCAKDENVSCIVLAGNQDVFCAGGENGDFRKQEVLQIKKFGENFIALHLSMVNFPKPIIAAVEGEAMGGGFSLVEACDLAVAADSALFAIPEMLAGLAPAMGLSGIFANLPKKRVMALGLLGEKLTAEEAKRLGMINEVVPKDQVLQRALEIGKTFNKLTPTGLRLFKELYADMGMGDYERRLHLGQSMMVTLFCTPDGEEALNYKDENREPIWTGRGEKTL